MKEENKYSDIINLPHHQSKNRPHMSNFDRAAQFSPFAALKGYDDEIDEAARLTEMQLEADDERIREINEKLLLLKELASQHPLVAITYFKPDDKKDGGAYLTSEGALKKLDEYNRQLLLSTNVKIQFDDIIKIDFI
ncbi:MAG: hypothetical protein J1F65_05360 [Clostridiales bacterium]|nr:hypothetical protein [Clostridiales bacterium]